MCTGAFKTDHAPFQEKTRITHFLDNHYRKVEAHVLQDTHIHK
jgi:hypothetical protein